MQQEGSQEASDSSSSHGMQQLIKRKSSGIQEHLRDDDAAHNVCHWAGQSLKIRLDASPEFLRRYEQQRLLHEEEQRQKASAVAVAAAAAAAATNTKSNDEAGSTIDNNDADVVPKPEQKHSHRASRRSSWKPELSHANSTIELQVLSWGRPALDVVTESRSAHGKFIPIWKTVSTLSIDAGRIEVEAASDDSARSMDEAAQKRPAFLPPQSNCLDFLEPSDDEAESSRPNSPHVDRIKAAASAPRKRSLSQHTFVQYTFRGDKAPRCTGLYRCVYILHRAISAGNRIVPTQKEQSQMKAAQDLSASSGSESKRSNSEHGKNEHNAHDHEAEASPAPLKRQFSSKKRSRPTHGQYIISRSELIQVRSTV